MAKIKHDAEFFKAEIATHIYKGCLPGAVEVITRDGDPETLLAVVRAYGDFNTWYSNGKTYKTYQHAYAALGAAIDRVNPEHKPLSDNWAE